MTFSGYISVRSSYELFTTRWTSRVNTLIISMRASRVLSDNIHSHGNSARLLCSCY